MLKAYGLNRRCGLSKDLKIGVFLGGDSPERAVSLRSGKTVAKALENAGFKVCLIDPRRENVLKKRGRPFDIAFIALHGRGGEDGSIQRLLERRGIPYTGSGPAGCKASYDKYRTKKVLKENRISTAEFTLIRDSNWERRLKAFPLPFFVKPLEDGSSLGIFCVEDLQNSKRVIKRALSRYGCLLAEKKIFGREFTVGVLGNKPLPVIEIKPRRTFYDYRSKYTKGLCSFLVPAPIPDKTKKRIQKCGMRVHKALGLRDFSRVDMIVNKDGRPYVLEANSIPGLTEMSLLPKAAQKAGISFEALCVFLIHQACRRRGKRT